MPARLRWHDTGGWIVVHRRANRETGRAGPGKRPQRRQTPKIKRQKAKKKDVKTSLFREGSEV